MSKKVLLLLGPRSTKKSDHTGGIIVLFEDLLKYCNEEKILFEVIDTNKLNYNNKIHAYYSIIINLLNKSKNCAHISLHGTAKDFLFIGPIVILIGKFFSRETSLRKFAGSFDKVYIESTYFKKIIYQFTIRRTGLLFVETKHLVKFFNKMNPNIHWWPNSRRKSNISDFTNLKFEKKYVFISQIKTSKGIKEIIKASESLSEEYSIDIYGPIIEPHLEVLINKAKRVNYGGVINPSKVQSTLSKYDVLLLPTFHEGEGYPGIILEAFSMSKPVITTNWMSIPEIVKDGFNGKLIEPKNSEQLAKAIKDFSDENYKIYSENAKKSFAQFNSSSVYSTFFNLIHN